MDDKIKVVKKTLSKRCEEYIKEIEKKDVEIEELNDLKNQREFRLEEMWKDILGLTDEFELDDYDSDDNFNSHNNRERLKNLEKYPYKITRKSFNNNK